MMRRSLVLLIALALPGVLLQASAFGAADYPVAGLYMGRTWASSGPYNIIGRHFSDIYLYLSPEGSFAEGYSFFGYDQISATSDVQTGRYSVQKDEVTLRYADGTEKTIGREGDNVTYSHAGATKRLPNCDGIKLSGTYQYPNFNLTISFTPDGRFVDQGAMPQILNLTDSRLDSPARTLRPGPGTYTVKNHTLTLRYAHGPVFKLFFYVEGNDRGEIDPNIIQIHTDRLSRVEQLSTPPARLPKIEAPAGWKSQRDPTQKTTNLVPPNLPQGRALAVAITDPRPLPNPDVARFPSRLHEAGVQGAVKNYTSLGYRTEKKMISDTQGKVLSSSGVFDQPNGKRLWITIFTLVSSTEWQNALLISDHEDLYKAYLPMVKAMLGEGDASLQADMTSLSSLLSKMPVNVNALRGWTIEYDPKEKSTQFTPPDLSSGQIVSVIVGEREQMTGSLSLSHEESIRKAQADLDQQKWRLEGTTKQEHRDNALFSSLVYVLPNGMRAWLTLISTAVGKEGQDIALVTNSEALHKQYLPTAKAVLAELVGR